MEVWQGNQRVLNQLSSEPFEVEIIQEEAFYLNCHISPRNRTHFIETEKILAQQGRFEITRPYPGRIRLELISASGDVLDQKILQVN